MESPQDWKPAKKRVKALYAKIKEQVEFYFGDSNLDKDRFFKKQIDKSKDGSIPLSMLLSFNRVKALVEDVTVLQKALSTSTMLKLNEDKSSVRRITPYSKPKDVDKRTVYVELLPSNVDHDWIKRIFSRCGTISYISIPRYKSTGDPKSFAFVEFETVEGAKKACQILNNPPTEREHKPGKFPKHNKAMVQLRKKMNALDESEVKECDLSSNEKSKTSRQKRKRKISSCSAEGKDIQASKKQKSESLCGETLEEGCSKVLTEHQNESVLDSTKSEDEDKVCGGSGKKKKKRKQRQQSESSGNKSQEDEVSDKSRPRSDSFSKLHDSEGGSNSKYRRRAYSCSKLTDRELVGKVTVPKTEPESKPKAGEPAESEKGEEKELAKTGDDSVKEKSETNCQAETEEDFLCKERKQIKRKKESMESVCSDVENLPKHQKLNNDILEMQGERNDFKKRRHQHRKPKKHYPNLRVLSKEEWLQYKADYLNTQRSNMAMLKKMLAEKTKRQEPENQPSPAKENYEFIPNVIINVKSDLLLNIKEVKEKLNPIANIAYIDLKEVDVQAYIRCRDEESARTICDSSFPHYKFTLLQGEEEKMYWEKLRADREAKMNSKHRLKKRGTSKLMDKIEKLNTQNSKVYFDE